MMRLHNFYRSSASYRVRIALELKGIGYEYVAVDLINDHQATPAFKAINPEGLVPLLEDGELRISQSTAIIEYLEERHPDPPLLPGPIAERARVRALCQMIACDIHPLNNLRVLRYLMGPMGVSRDNKDLWYAHWVEEGLAQVETRLCESASGNFCHGDQPGMADCFLVPQVANAQRMKCNLSAMPRVREINERCLALEAFARAQPSRCPDNAD